MLLFKRILSISLLFCGTAFFVAALTTEYWWQKASPVPGPAYIKFSVMYMWKGLNSACTKIPPATVATCRTLHELGLDEVSTNVVRYTLYCGIGFCSLEIVVVAICLIVTKRLFMDFVCLCSFGNALIGTIALSIYTNYNPTIVNFFVFYGYSYVIGWLAVTCLFLSSLLALLSRLNKDGESFLTHGAMYRMNKNNKGTVSNCRCKKTQNISQPC